MNANEVNYTPNGPAGKTCLECTNYQADASNPDIGKCFGHDVVATGSCNFFQAK